MGISFAVLKKDRELLWLPFFSGSFCLLFSAIILCGGALFTLPSTEIFSANTFNRHSIRREDFSMAWQPKG
jgi:hypothetical protein